MSRGSALLAGSFLLAFGVALFASSALPRAGSVAPIAVPSPTATAAANGEPSASPSPSVAAIPEGYRIRIQRLGIDLPISEGDINRDVVVQRTPENFAFHLPGTAIPGSGGNSYIYAHARRGMFLSLWNARIGDEVVISTPGGGTLRFVVSEIHPRVPPEDTSWVQPSLQERITLQTSTGPNREDPRFVVVATPG